MESGVQDYELPHIMESLKSEDQETVHEALQQLIALCKAENSSEMIPHFHNLFEQLAVLLPNESQTISSHAS